jgi:ABC-2 type transport system permease protein
LSAAIWEFLRDRSALTWNLLFPVSLIAGFAFAFSGSGLDLTKSALWGCQRWQGSGEFFETRYIQFIPVVDRSPAVTKIERHQLDYAARPWRTALLDQ